MCKNGVCEAVCPAAKLATFIPPEKPCGKDPAELFPGTYDFIRKHGQFLPATVRTAGGKLENV